MYCTCVGERYCTAVARCICLGLKAVRARMIAYGICHSDGAGQYASIIVVGQSDHDD